MLGVWDLNEEEVWILFILKVQEKHIPMNLQRDVEYMCLNSLQD